MKRSNQPPGKPGRFSGVDNDTFVFADGFGVDTISDFDHSLSTEVIDLSAVTGITDFTDLVNNHISQNGGNSVITDGAGNSITLYGVLIADLDSGDFVFV